VFLSASFEKERIEPTYAHGTLSLYHGDEKVGEGKIKTQLGFFAVALLDVCRPATRPARQR
jgi:hypothetical protein